jgi:hypothetical protein
VSARDGGGRPRRRGRPLGPGAAPPCAAPVPPAALPDLSARTRPPAVRAPAFRVLRVAELEALIAEQERGGFPSIFTNLKLSRNAVPRSSASSCLPPTSGGLTLPPVESSRPGGIEKGSLDTASDTGGSVSRGVGDGVTLGDSVGTPVLPVISAGPLGSARSSPPSVRSTTKYTSSSRGTTTPAICRILLFSGRELHGYAPVPLISLGPGIEPGRDRARARDTSRSALDEYTLRLGPGHYAPSTLTDRSDR